MMSERGEARKRQEDGVMRQVSARGACLGFAVLVKIEFGTDIPALHLLLPSCPPGFAFMHFALGFSRTRFLAFLLIKQNVASGS